ncbi:MAG: bifunctional proline dehydrogenase/L-glutamate gamma-semialdehyde dehydrogenase PutA, partial [Gammaproteobacteria bacterium]|nr:bifunctional proline dehydrogenase/L-glutamate gamma-semialdehyde dehydrogenase PutA [Gammaproteobacteria bacterium]
MVDSSRPRPMIYREVPDPPGPLRAAVRAAHLADESEHLEALLGSAAWTDEQRARVEARAGELVAKVRARAKESGGLDAFLAEYDLSSEEGVVLMCLAEALLRIPDNETLDRLIEDRLASADWARHLGESQPLLVNAATWGLLLTGRVVRLGTGDVDSIGSLLGRLAARGGEPLVRSALRQAMRLIGHHFVMGRTIDEALGRARHASNRIYRYSFDMLGEAALTRDDAERYFGRYREAIDTLAASEAAAGEGDAAAGVSVKLSALHPRLELAQRARLLAELVPRVSALAEAARAAGLGLTLDAEEADRLEPMLDVFEAVLTDPALEGWEGLGIVVQAYQKRAAPLIDWLGALARRTHRRIPVRLVKGAYWDTEIKRAQERGLDDYPVFTRKRATDVSYLACARRLLADERAFYPQFATHNAYTVAAVLELAGARPFEFQRLHGMGEGLYRDLVAAGTPCRVYAPVGGHDELLPYLVRRLLENGANTSFINRLLDARAPVENLVADPVASLRASAVRRHPRIPPPADLYAPARRNSQGLNLHDPAVLAELARAMRREAARGREARPVVSGAPGAASAPYAARNPAIQDEVIGEVHDADPQAVEQALAAARGAFPAWSTTPVETRAACLERAADLYERHRTELMTLCVQEAGHCLTDALSEVREAVDFLRYYAWRARRELGA